MDDVIKREDASEVKRKINECKNHLQRGNVFSCIICFRDALEKIQTIKMLPADEKELMNEINIFQSNLSNSKIFCDVYGPVTFRDNDLATALDFMKQLITIKEEETAALMQQNEADQAGSHEFSAAAAGEQNTAQEVKILIERGDYSIAQEKIAGDEELMEKLLAEYNASGIKFRRAGRFDEALSEFKKALVVQPRDEGLYYNIARVCIDKQEWKKAAETINEGLKINPLFSEGVKLLKYIRETAKIDV